MAWHWKQFSNSHYLAFAEIEVQVPFPYMAFKQQNTPTFLYQLTLTLFWQDCYVFFINFFNEFTNKSIYTSQNSAMCGNSRPLESSSELKNVTWPQTYWQVQSPYVTPKTKRDKFKSLCNAKFNVTSSSPKKYPLQRQPSEKVVYLSVLKRPWSKRTYSPTHVPHGPLPKIIFFNVSNFSAWSMCEAILGKTPDWPI